MKKLLSALLITCLFVFLIANPVFASSAPETNAYDSPQDFSRIVDERYAATVRFYSYSDTIPESIYYEEYESSIGAWYRGTLHKRLVNYLPNYISVVYDGYIYAQI